MRALLLPFLASSIACYAGIEDAPDRETRDHADAVADDSADLVDARRTMRHPASGWLDHEGSPILPWCGAVLVAPDVAVTSARCVEGWDRSFLAVGFGPVDGEPHEIDEILVQRDDAIEREHALAAVHLAQPIFDVDPVTLAVPEEATCDVQSISYRYVLRDEPSPRALWSGCLDEAELRADDGAPNCHGDMGAGAFLPDGALVGVAVDAWSEGGCAPGHRLATVTANEAFFTAALDLSRPPV